jgi:hypothetical protein
MPGLESPERIKRVNQEHASCVALVQLHIDSGGKVRLSFSGLSIRGPLGMRFYFRACKPCKTRRPCDHRR